MNEGPLALFKEEQMSRSGCGGQGGDAGQLCRIFFRSHVSAQLRRPNFGQPDPAPVLAGQVRKPKPASPARSYTALSVFLKFRLNFRLDQSDPHDSMSTAGEWRRLMGFG